MPEHFKVEEWEAFVYEIVSISTGRKYIGKKVFWNKRKIKISGKSRRKLVRLQSNWGIYKSSSEELQKDINLQGERSFEFHILYLCKTRAEANYLEVKEQFVRDVLYSKLPNGQFEYYNHQINGRWYRRR